MLESTKMLQDRIDNISTKNGTTLEEVQDFNYSDAWVETRCKEIQSPQD